MLEMIIGLGVIGATIMLFILLCLFAKVIESKKTPVWIKTILVIVVILALSYWIGWGILNN